MVIPHYCLAKKAHRNTGASLPLSQVPSYHHSNTSHGRKHAEAPDCLDSVTSAWHNGLSRYSELDPTQLCPGVSSQVGRRRCARGRIQCLLQFRQAYIAGGLLIFERRRNCQVGTRFAHFLPVRKRSGVVLDGFDRATHRNAVARRFVPGFGQVQVRREHWRCA